MSWTSDWLWGVSLLVLTVVFHVSAFMLITRALVPEMTGSKDRIVPFIVSVALIALCATILHALEATAWAVLYVKLHALPDFSNAILYSLGALTSYGHANIFLAHSWRLLGSIEAVNGLILFGLTTAFFFAAIQKAWPSHKD